MARQKQQPLEHRLLLTATFCLLAGGAVMVYSRLVGAHDAAGRRGRHRVPAQVRRLRVGRPDRDVRRSRGMNLELVRRYTTALLILAFVLLVLVKMPGVGREGQRRASLGGLRPAAVPAERDHEDRAGAAHRGGGRGQAEDRAQHPDARRAGDRRRRRGGAADRAAARPRHRPRDLRDRRRDGRRGGAADAPARARVRRRRDAGDAVRDPRAVPARAADVVPGPVGPRRRRGLPGRPGPDRDRLRRAVRPRPGRVDPEDLLRSRGAHRLHPGRHRRGARPGGHPGAAVSCTASSGTPGCGPPATPRAPTPSSSPPA